MQLDSDQLLTKDVNYNKVSQVFRANDQSLGGHNPHKADQPIMFAISDTTPELMTGNKSPQDLSDFQVQYNIRVAMDRSLKDNSITAGNSGVGEVQATTIQ